MSEVYWNWESDSEIVCPYCSKTYTPTYEETWIGDELANCYEDGEIQTFKCDRCGKKFTMRPQLRWNYETETIDGEMTEDEHENMNFD